MPIADENMVSAQFWANLTAERIYNAMDTAKAAAGRLQQFIIWVFGIFSTLTFTGIVFAKKEDWNEWALLVLGIALGMLVYAYWLSIKSTYPFAFSVQVGNEDSEKQAYKDTIKEIRHYLGLSFRFCAFGTLFYAIGILIQFGTPLAFGQSKVQLNPLVIKAKTIENDRSVQLHILSAKNSYVTLFLETDTLIGKKKQTILAFEKNDGYGKMVYVDDNGNALVNLKYSAHDNIYLKAEKTDSIKGGGEQKTIIRIKVFQAPKKQEENKKAKG